jgi:hypothetical protein
MVTTVLYRGNIKDLPVLSVKLINLFNRFGVCFSLEFRLIYVEGTIPSLLKISLPRNFATLKKSLEESITMLSRANVSFTLWNFPLCYLENPKPLASAKMKERQERRLVKIHKDAQMKKAEIRDWEDYLKPHQACQKCRLKEACSGIDRDYIEKYNFPRVQSLVKI